MFQLFYQRFGPPEPDPLEIPQGFVSLHVAILMPAALDPQRLELAALSVVDQLVAADPENACQDTEANRWAAAFELVSRQ